MPIDQETKAVRYQSGHPFIIHLTGKPAFWLARGILVLLTLVLVLVTCSGIIALITAPSPGLAALLASTIGAFGAFYFLRLFLWNNQPREQLELHPNQLVYIADYTWFKNKQILVRNVEFSVSIVTTPESKNGMKSGTLELKNKFRKCTTAIVLPENELAELQQEIYNYYSKIPLTTSEG